MKVFKLKATLLLIMLVAMLAFVSANFTKDKQECNEQLITLSPCINYVASEAVKPSPQCCAILHEKINKIEKCLCILVKDRNEPGLGLKLNATRALRLPSICRTPSNSLDCLGLLGLTPNSPDAQIFIEAANYTQAEPTANPRSNGGWRRLATMGMFQLILLWALLSVFVVNFYI